MLAIQHHNRSQVNALRKFKILQYLLILTFSPLKVLDSKACLLLSVTMVNKHHSADCCHVRLKLALSHQAKYTLLVHRPKYAN